MNLIHNPTIKFSIYIMLVIVFAVSSILFLIDKIENKTKQLQEKRSILLVSQQRDNNFLELKNSYEIVENNQKTFEQIFPNENNIEKFIITLENTAKNTNNIQTLSFDQLRNATIEGENIKSIKFTIILTGNISSFINYLNEIKKISYFIEIENIALNNSLGITNNDSRMNIKSKVYIRN